MKKSKNSVVSKKPNFYLVLVLGVVLSLVGYKLYFKSQTTTLSEPQNLTYTSSKAHFSFQYPASWPFSVATDEEIKGSNVFAEPGYGKIESIDFNEQWERSATDARLGLIEVSKNKDIQTLEDYIKAIDKETEIGYPGGETVMMPAPKIEEVTIGGVPGVKITAQDSGAATLSPVGGSYVVVKDGLVYAFSSVQGETFNKNKEQNTIYFQQLLDSVLFTE
ncbi:MAG: hypothetical protein ACEQSA_05800 [Weeksellaceae bacterium]